MFQTQKTKLFLVTVITAIMAGMIYNSWPLGYLLNPLVSRRGLASELEALHQPYNWLFIFMDVLSGLLVTGVAIMLWRFAYRSIQKVVLINFALFGILTAVSALVPMSCDPSLMACPSFTHQPLLIVHGVASIVASVCLFVSVCIVWWQKREQKGSLIMSILLAGWTLFGIISVYFFFAPGPGYLAQHYYITLCSVWVVVLPFMFEMQPLVPSVKTKTPVRAHAQVELRP